jgi:hypothetical protein
VVVAPDESRRIVRHQQFQMIVAITFAVAAVAFAAWQAHLDRVEVD